MVGHAGLAGVAHLAIASLENRGVIEQRRCPFTHFSSSDVHEPAGCRVGIGVADAVLLAGCEVHQHHGGARPCKGAVRLWRIRRNGVNR